MSLWITLPSSSSWSLNNSYRNTFFGVGRFIVGLNTSLLHKEINIWHRLLKISVFYSCCWRKYALHGSLPSTEFSGPSPTWPQEGATTPWEQMMSPGQGCCLPYELQESFLPICMQGNTFQTGRRHIVERALYKPHRARFVLCSDTN